MIRACWVGDRENAMTIRPYWTELTTVTRGSKLFSNTWSRATCTSLVGLLNTEFQGTWAQVQDRPDSNLSSNTPAATAVAIVVTTAYWQTIDGIWICTCSTADRKSSVVICSSSRIPAADHSKKPSLVVQNTIYPACKVSITTHFQKMIEKHSHERREKSQKLKMLVTSILTLNILLFFSSIFLSYKLTLNYESVDYTNPNFPWNFCKARRDIKSILD